MVTIPRDVCIGVEDTSEHEEFKVEVSLPNMSSGEEHEPPHDGGAGCGV